MNITPDELLEALLAITYIDGSGNLLVGIREDEPLAPHLTSQTHSYLCDQHRRKAYSDARKKLDEQYSDILTIERPTS